MQTRRGLAAVIVGALSVALMVGAGGGAFAAGNKVKAKLSGKDEAPGPGDPDGRGDAQVKLKKKKKQVCFNISFEKIENPVAGHIHKGKKKVAGPIKVTLFEDPTGLPSPIANCVKGVKKKLIKKIKKKPQNWYVNLHTLNLPAGAIRGQLKRGG